MPLLLTDSAWSMQPEPTTGVAEPGAGPTGGPGPAGCAAANPQLLMLGVMFGVFYFLLIRPQQKRQREVDDLLKALRKGDKVRTSGGIRGEIVELTDSEVTLLIADKVKINVLRSHVASRIDARVDKAGAEAKPDDSKAKATGG